jgi:hypothetical protein
VPQPTTLTECPRITNSMYRKWHLFIVYIFKREEKARKRREDISGLECCKGESPMSGCLWGSFLSTKMPILPQRLSQLWVVMSIYSTDISKSGMKCETRWRQLGVPGVGGLITGWGSAEHNCNKLTHIVQWCYYTVLLRGRSPDRNSPLLNQQIPSFL